MVVQFIRRSAVDRPYTSTHVHLQRGYAMTLIVAMWRALISSPYYHMLSTFCIGRVPDLAQHLDTLNHFRYTTVTMRTYLPHIKLCLVYHLCSLIWTMIFLIATISTYFVNVWTRVKMVLVCATITVKYREICLVPWLYPQFLVNANQCARAVINCLVSGLTANDAPGYSSLCGSTPM